MEPEFEPCATPYVRKIKDSEPARLTHMLPCVTAEPQNPTTCSNQKIILQCQMQQLSPADREPHNHYSLG